MRKVSPSISRSFIVIRMEGFRKTLETNTQLPARHRDRKWIQQRKQEWHSLRGNMTQMNE
jgi:hypothetical protein